MDINEFRYAEDYLVIKRDFQIIYMRNEIYIIIARSIGTISK